MKVIHSGFNVPYSYPVIFTRSVFDPDNPALADLLKQTGKLNRVLPVIDANVLAANPGLIAAIQTYAECYPEVLKIVGGPVIVTGGEACKKGMAEVEKIYTLINEYHLCRHSFVMVIGGGAVLDAMGFAVATAHRGLRLLRLPTTTLAQNDAGIGVKNSVNLFGKKNFIGTFAPPFAVINDLEFLWTLEERDLRAGISEAVKVALIKDRAFFEYLYENRYALRGFEPSAMEHMIVRCAEIHMDHIQTSGDPFELGSSRPLDFGHWAAHKIEDLADGDIRHGEAVAIGIALDSLYSHFCGLISELDLHKILSLLRAVGFELFHPALAKMNIDVSLNEFREHMGGELTIPLIKNIGSLTEVHEMDTTLLARAIQTLAVKHQRKELTDDHQQQPNDGKTGTGPVFPR